MQDNKNEEPPAWGRYLSQEIHDFIELDKGDTTLAMAILNNLESPLLRHDSFYYNSKADGQTARKLLLQLWKKLLESFTWLDASPTPLKQLEKRSLEYIVAIMDRPEFDLGKQLDHIKPEELNSFTPPFAAVPPVELKLVQQYASNMGLTLRYLLQKMKKLAQSPAAATPTGWKRFCVRVLAVAYFRVAQLHLPILRSACAADAVDMKRLEQVLAAHKAEHKEDGSVSMMSSEVLAARLRQGSWQDVGHLPNANKLQQPIGSGGPNPDKNDIIIPAAARTENAAPNGHTETKSAPVHDNKALGSGASAGTNTNGNGNSSSSSSTDLKLGQIQLNIDSNSPASTNGISNGSDSKASTPSESQLRPLTLSTLSRAAPERCALCTHSWQMRLMQQIAEWRRPLQPQIITRARPVTPTEGKADTAPLLKLNGVVPASDAENKDTKDNILPLLSSLPLMPRSPRASSAAQCHMDMFSELMSLTGRTDGTGTDVETIVKMTEEQAPIAIDLVRWLWLSEETGKALGNDTCDEVAFRCLVESFQEDRYFYEFITSLLAYVSRVTREGKTDWTFLVGYGPLVTTFLHMMMGKLSGKIPNSALPPPASPPAGSPSPPPPVPGDGHGPSQRLPPTLKRCQAVLLTNPDLLGFLIEISLRSTKVQETDGVVETMQNIHLWYAITTKNLSPLANFPAPAAPSLPDIPAPKPRIPLNPPHMCYPLLFDGIRQCLLHEHHLILQAALNFTYEHMLAWPAEERAVFLSSVFLEPNLFTRLFSHWNYQIRRIIIHLLLYPLSMPLLIEAKTPETKKGPPVVEKSSGSCWACFGCCFSSKSMPREQGISMETRNRNRVWVDQNGGQLADFVVFKMTKLDGQPATKLKSLFEIYRAGKVPPGVSVYIKKALQEFDHYQKQWQELRESNQGHLDADEMIMPAEVPIDAAGEADGGGGNNTNRAAAERLKRKQEEIERLNTELAKLNGKTPIQAQAAL